MTKKKAKPDGYSQMVEEMTEEKTEELVEETKPEPSPKPMGILEEHFTLGKWKGHPNYSCCYCSWSGIEKIRATDHYTGNHMALPKSKTVGAKLYDRFGNIIEEI